MVIRPHACHSWEHIFQGQSSQRALRFGHQSIKGSRDFGCSAFPPPTHTHPQTHTHGLTQQYRAGGGGGNRRIGRWAEQRWSSKPESRKWLGVQWLPRVCPFKLTCELITPLLDNSNCVVHLHLIPFTIWAWIKAGRLFNIQCLVSCLKLEWNEF